MYDDAHSRQTRALGTAVAVAATCRGEGDADVALSRVAVLVDRSMRPGVALRSGHVS
jgi:hypothetical protein